MRTPEGIRPVYNGHTDGSAPIVNGFVKNSTGLPKDLAVRNTDARIAVITAKNGKEVNQMNQWDLQRGLDSGEKLVNLAAFTVPFNKETGQFEAPKGPLLDVYMQHHQVYDGLLQRGGNQIAEVTTKESLDKIVNSDNTLGMIRSIEGVYGEHTLKDVDAMVEKGVKIWCPMWSEDNPDTGKAAGTTGSPEDTGLTVKGKDLVRHLAINRRVVVDLSHASDQTAHDVLDIAANGVPAIASHSGSRTITDHKRNLPDDLALRIAQQGGIIGIQFVDIFAGTNAQQAVEHIEYFANLGILDAITLGPDFDGMSTAGLVVGLENPEEAYKNIAQIMESRGFTDAQIDGVLFNNALRFVQKHIAA